MSGHSKWANIKHRKEGQDQKRGQVFSKLARAIAIAVKEGGSVDPESNAKLRTLIQQAKEANMPKENIRRAIEAGQKHSENLTHFILEGYGPHSVAIIVDVATNNRQRSVQEIKNIFSRSGGRLAEPGAVSFQFTRQAKVVTPPLNEGRLLAVMDFGKVEDWQDDGEEVVFTLVPDYLGDFLDFLKKEGIVPQSDSIIMEAKTPLDVNDGQHRQQINRFLDELRQHDDVQAIYTNLAEK